MLTAAAAILLLAILAASYCEATWSLVMADTQTKEISISSVTCVSNLDLKALLPVMLVGVGGACVQAAGDYSGTRRPVIRDELLAGTTPADIITILSSMSNHQSMQYGILSLDVAVANATATFTGSATSAWAGGFTGVINNRIVYSLQGNILAGSCVLNSVLDEMNNTHIDLAEKAMVSLQRAKQAGGDGRCSCSSARPTSCGCPPNNDNKCGHVGFLMGSRLGDTDSAICNAGGCARGDYFLDLNVPSTTANQDPVDVLQDMYDDWRMRLN